MMNHRYFHVTHCCRRLILMSYYHYYHFLNLMNYCYRSYCYFHLSCYLTFRYYSSNWTTQCLKNHDCMYLKNCSPYQLRHSECFH